MKNTRDTSAMAYSDIKGKISDRHREIMVCFNDPGEALTDSEIMRRLGKSDPNYVRPRRFELVDMGVIVLASKRPCSVTGKTCCAWKVADAPMRLI